MAKHITVTIDKLGNTKVETKGFAGAECERATADLEDALGGRISNVRTAEYRNQPETTRTVDA